MEHTKVYDKTIELWLKKDQHYLAYLNKIGLKPKISNDIILQALYPKVLEEK